MKTEKYTLEQENTFIIKNNEESIGLRGTAEGMMLASDLPDDKAADGVEARRETDKIRQRWAMLPQVLRWLGGTTLVLSALCFLGSGWLDAEPLPRYYSFLGFTAALGLSGLFCGLRWKDDKGARSFLALATAFVPVHFAQLGAFYYAIDSGPLVFREGLQLFQFGAIPTPSFLITLVLALLVLLPLSYTGFSAMARVEAKRLTLLYFLSSAALLIPDRTESVITILSFILLGVLVWADRRWFSPHSIMKHWDGIFVRSLLFVPLGILVGRNVVLHGLSGVLMSFIYAVLFSILFFGVPRCVKSDWEKSFSQSVSMIPLFLSWFHIVDVAWNIRLGVFREGFVPFVLIPFTAIVSITSIFANGGGEKLRRNAAIVAVFSLVYQLFVFGGVSAAMLCVVVSIFVVAGAFILEDRFLFRVGVLGLVLGAFWNLKYAIDDLWIGFGVTGTIVLLLSSFIERHGGKTGERGLAFKGRLNTWK